MLLVWVRVRALLATAAARARVEVRGKGVGEGKGASESGGESWGGLSVGVRVGGLSGEACAPKAAGISAAHQSHPT